MDEGYTYAKLYNLYVIAVTDHEYEEVSFNNERDDALHLSPRKIAWLVEKFPDIEIIRVETVVNETAVEKCDIELSF